MASLTINLPDDRVEFLRKQAEARGASVDDYLDALLGQFQARESNRKRLEALLIEGLESGPAEPWTEEDWESIRREGRERLKEMRRETKA
jgi:antitoxin ParD1/3/4